ncbi:MAG: DNA repair protein RadC [Deltaproteobacteria bacterium]|nr:DNA repair protein RadC [Deltaproteobacteria bacterium]
MASEKPHYHGHRKRLRERFLRSGFTGMGDHEVVEIILTLAIPYKDVKEPAKALLARFGNLKGIFDAPLDELGTIPGIGSVAPTAFRIMREAANLYLQQKAEAEITLASPELLYDFWRSRLGGLKDEVFEVAYLDAGYKLLRDGVERLEEGTVDRASVYPRRVMEATLRKGAVTLIFAHNHTNGNVNPSEQDKILTKALVLAASTLHIKVYDHLIVSKDEVFSFRKEGLL